VLPVTAGQFLFGPRDCLEPQVRDTDSRAWGSYFAELIAANKKTPPALEAPKSFFEAVNSRTFCLGRAVVNMGASQSQPAPRLVCVMIVPAAG
jgi:hypothetical protein